MGRATFIVSAAGNGLVQMLARVLGMDGGIGTRCEVGADGVLTGGSSGPSSTARARWTPCAASPTSTRSTWPRRRPTPDSASDLPMLRAVGNPVVVNPDHRLAEDRPSRGLAVMRFERLGRRLAIGGATLAAAVGGTCRRACANLHGSGGPRPRADPLPEAGARRLDWHMAVEPEARRRHEWQEVYAQAEDARLFRDHLGPAGEAALHRGGRAPDPERDVGYPGEYPYTRGVYPSMYRGRLWTMRQFAGFGTAEETNERFRYLLEHGQTGLSTAFDMPTLMGLDSDHRPAASARWGGGRGGGHARRHGDPLPGHPDGRGHHLDDDQRAGRGDARLLRGRRRASSGIPAERARGHDPDRHPQGVHRPEGVVLPDRVRRCGWSRT